MDVRIFDMDGTLNDVRGVRHYILESRNFDLFHRASVWCPSNQWVVELAQNGEPNIIVTARDTRYEWVTRNWLAKYDVPFLRLYMRAWGDTRKDFVVKQEILDQIRRDGYNPILAVDDNPNVIELWQQNDIPTIVVPGWSEQDGKVSYAEMEQ